MKPPKIYLDVCALSRPFDDQNYLRIRLETEAVNLILSKVKEERYSLLVSPAHIKEIAAISDPYERIELETLLDRFGARVSVNLDKARERAEELIDLGFGVADAAHIAFAEKMGASFISCDDKLIRKCLNHKIQVWCGSPVAFCEREELK